MNCSSTPLRFEKAPLPLTLRCNWTDFHQLAILKKLFQSFTSAHQQLQHLLVAEGDE